MEDVTEPPISERSRRWAATMEGYEGAADDVTVAHRDSSASIDVSATSHTPRSLAEREDLLDTTFAVGDIDRGRGIAVRDRDVVGRALVALHRGGPASTAF